MGLLTQKQKPRASAATATRVINKDLAGAKALIAQFSQTINNQSFESGFNAIGRNHHPQILHDLRQRIASPWLIDQHTSSLCGPAALFYCLAKDAPQLYVQCMIDLFCTGSAIVHNLRLTPSSDCRNARVPTRMSPVDWVMLASLRDSSNSFFNYDSASDQLAGITLPGHLKRWFEQVGYSSVQERSNLYFDGGTDNLIEAQNAFNANKNVCLFISAKALSLPFSVSVIPNHWVVMSRPFLVGSPPSSIYGQKLDDIEDKTFSLPVFTWGREKYDLNEKRLTVGEFGDYYFGFVSAS